MSITYASNFQIHSITNSTIETSFYVNLPPIYSIGSGTVDYNGYRNDSESAVGIASFHGSAIYSADSVINYFFAPETEEQKETRVRREEETRKAGRRARMLFIKVAGKKAYKLLRKNGHYDAIGFHGQRYRLAIGEQVRVMEGSFGDKVLHRLCAYVPDVPAVDTLLAQYLALTSGLLSEEEFKKIAIKHAA
ncbi:MAG: hypothetical protein HC814_06575 [Rhodobacteraceae bacterium]|nr:hypothetical protein [Paracoccaceae bacterium]